jgi:hypothetical protein
MHNHTTTQYARVKTPGRNGDGHDGIPDELKALDRWVVAAPGTKVPLQAGGANAGRAAKANDPSTWVSYEEAEEFNVSVYAGEGTLQFALNGDGIVGIDLDKVRNPRFKSIDPRALAIIAQLNTYSEISPSGCGIRMFLYGTLPPKGRRKDWFEVYDNLRVLSVTGRRLEGLGGSDRIEQRQEQLAALHAEIFGSKPTGTTRVRGGAAAPSSTGSNGDTDGTITLHVPPTIDPDCLDALFSTYPAALAAFNGKPIGDKSQSNRDWAVGRDAMKCGWSDQDIVNLLVEARLRCDEAIKPVGYFALTVANIRARGVDGEGPAPDPVPERPLIIVTTDEHVVNDAAVEVLAADPSVYQRGGILAHVVRASEDTDADGIRRPAGSTRIVPLPLPLLRERLAAGAEFVRVDHTGKAKPIHPPSWCVQAVHARGQWRGVRELAGVVEAPVLRPDGTILQKPGYDPATGLLFSPRREWPTVPEAPTREEAYAARDVLLDLVADFPFAKPVHRSGWLAFLLTLLARHAFDGPAPLFLFDGNTPGAGKGFLVELATVIAHGTETPCSIRPDEDAEMRKHITAAAMAGDSLIVLDNVTGMLGCDALDAALTGTRWKDRVLGTNTRVDLPLNVTWAATGNNVMLRRDTRRRVVQVRLETPLENPQDRTDFRRPQLRAYVRDNRPELLTAALTVLRGFTARRPGWKPARSPVWGSFEGWTDLVCQAAVWAGLDDPGLTQLDLRERHADPDTEALPALLAGIEFLDATGNGLTVAEIVSLCELSPTPGFMAALTLLAPGRNAAEKVNVRSLGMRLHHLRGSVIGGMHLDRRADNVQNVGRWRVVRD